MFYSDLLLGKRSALGKVWEYAHKSSQLSRREISMVDINQSIKAIEDPLAPMALRAQGQLLYGVCRVYDGKTKVLMEDAQNAQSKLISSRINQSKNMSLNMKRAAADQSVQHIMAPSAAISLGEGDDFESTFQVLNHSINAAFDDFSSQDAVRLSMSQARLSEISMNQSMLHDISLEQARGTQSAHDAINQSMRFDEFEISGGGFSIDDDIDDALLNQITDQSAAPADDQANHIEPDMYEDQPMVDHEQDNAQQQPEDNADDSINQSLQIEVARDAEVEMARRSVGAILGLDATDIDIDMTDLDPILTQQINPAATPARNQQTQPAAASESPKPCPAKRAKVVQFRLEEDSAARLSDAELKRRLADPSDLTSSRADQSITQSANRRRFAPNVLTTLMHSSVFSVGTEDPLDQFMAELFSVQGLQAAPLDENDVDQSVDQSVDQGHDQSMNQSRISNMSDIVGGDIDLGFDEPLQVDDHVEHQVDDQVEQDQMVNGVDEFDQPIDVQQGSELSSLEINESPLFDQDELVENERLARESSRLTEQFFHSSERQEPDNDVDDVDQVDDSVAPDSSDFGARSRTVLKRLKPNFDTNSHVSFEEVVPESREANKANPRNPRIASSLFYQLLVLSQKNAIVCHQDSFDSVLSQPIDDSEPFDFPEIKISKGPSFDAMFGQPIAAVSH